MARTDWAALIINPAREYAARTELERYGLTPYLPQCRRRCRLAADNYVLRQYPLFPGYVLIPINQTQSPNLRFVPNIMRTPEIPSGILHSNGRPWRATAMEIHEIREAEIFGRFDDQLREGHIVTFTNPSLAHLRGTITKVISPSTVSILTPLFGGSKAVAKTKNIGHNSTHSSDSPEGLQP